MEKDLKVLLLDDEAASLEYSFLVLKDFVLETNIYKALSVQEAYTILKVTNIDVAFLDVELPNGNGLEFTNFVHHQYPNIKVVILTGHVDYALEAYEYEPFDFLVKPLNVVRLDKTFKKLENLDKPANGDKVMIETGSGFVMVEPGSIKYIVKEKYGVEIILDTNIKYRVNYSLDYLESIFGKYGFFRVHQSYLVLTDKIANVQTSRFGTSYEATLSDGTLIPVSRGKYNKLKEYLTLRSFKLN